MTAPGSALSILSYELTIGGDSLDSCPPCRIWKLEELADTQSKIYKFFFKELVVSQNILLTITNVLKDEFCSHRIATGSRRQLASI